MKKLFALLLCAAMLLLCSCAPTGDTPTDVTGDTGDTGNTGSNEDVVKDYTGTFRVGFGRVNVTPELGIGLAGMGDDATRKAQFIGDQLYITCIAVTDEQENTLLLMSADSIRTETWVCDEMRDTISKELNVPRENIFYSSTHSHNTPDSTREGYTQIMQNGGLEACRLAMADRSTAEMYSTTTHSDGLNFVRHYLLSDGTYYGDGFGDKTNNTLVSHETEVDNEVQLIKFTRAAGKDIILMNWRAHPILTAGFYRDVSSGYIGPCRKYMEKNLDCHFAYFQGASGNVKDVSEMPDQNFKTYKEQGEKLAQCAIDALPEMKKLDTGLVEVKTVKYLGNIRVDSQEYIDAATTFKALRAKGSTVAEARAATGGLVNSDHALTNINMRKQAILEGKGKYEIEIAAISIGGLALVTTPHEMFDNTGVQIKEGSPYEQTFILGYCNGRAKYLPSEPAYTNGCYEKELSYVVKGAADEHANLYIDMLKEVYKDGVVDPAITTFDSKLPNNQ